MTSEERELLIAERAAKRLNDEKVMSFVQDLVGQASLLDNHKEEVCNALERQHRTHQQSTTDFLLSWFGHLADMKQRHATDMRNDEAAKIGMEIVEKVLAPRFGCTAEEFLKREYHLHRLLPYI